MALVYIVVFYIIFIGVYKIIITRKENAKYSVPKKIKKKYKKISVPTNEIDILTNGYYEENDTDNLLSVKVANSLYDKNDNVNINHKFISVMICKVENMTFKSKPINLPPSKIKNALITVPSVDIYFDESDVSNCIFDLFFLVNF